MADPPAPSALYAEAVNVRPRRWLDPGGESARSSPERRPSSLARAGDSAKYRLLPVTMPSVVSPHSCKVVKSPAASTAMYAASALVDISDGVHLPSAVWGFHSRATPAGVLRSSAVLTWWSSQ